MLGMRVPMLKRKLFKNMRGKISKTYSDSVIHEVAYLYDVMQKTPAQISLEKKIEEKTVKYFIQQLGLWSKERERTSDPKAVYRSMRAKEGCHPGCTHRDSIGRERYIKVCSLCFSIIGSDNTDGGVNTNGSQTHICKIS